MLERFARNHHNSSQIVQSAMVNEQERKIWAKARSALETTDCPPKNVHTAKEALERTRKALRDVVRYFQEKDSDITRK
jgi:hypothetical protein